MSPDIDIESIREEIESIQGSSVEPIHKGYSGDKKFLVHTKNDKELLLKIFDLNEYDRKHDEFNLLRQMEKLGVNGSKPVEIGKLSTAGYMLLTYIDGTDAADELPRYSENEQYAIGMEAGEELRKINQLSAPPGISSWFERKAAKHQRYIRQYRDCGVSVRNDEKIMSFIDRNIGCMEKRPNMFQHDDFHVGNLIVKDKRLSGVIDYNRYDWGDPVHEFLKVGIFSREISVPFSIGQIHGYFQGGEPPEMFWRLYSLYAAMSVFSSVVWTLKAAPDTLREMMEKIEMVLEDHDDFDRMKPGWYQD